MKRTNPTGRKWLFLRAINQKKRVFRKERLASSSGFRNATGRSNQNTAKASRLVKIWQGGPEEIAISTRAPSPAPATLCFEKNLSETIEFFSGVRLNFSKAIRRKKNVFVSRPSKRRPARIPGYSDFAAVKYISMAAAVVLAADYDLLKSNMKDVPPTINLRKWNPIVVTTLYQLGFFNILGHAPDPNLIVKDGEFLLMRIIRSKNTEKLAEVDVALSELGRFLSLSADALDETVTHALTMISEVMSNVTQHAYSGSVPIMHRHMESFWVAAEANKVDRTLRIVLYDQGATIPATFPRLERNAWVRKYLRRALRQSTAFDFEDDGTYIRAALRYGGSRTDLDYRGKGFPQMIELLGTLGGGELRIFSRGGWCVRSSNGKVTSGSHNRSIAGTVVEWKIEL